jgi:hypothetical protein
MIPMVFPLFHILIENGMIAKSKIVHEIDIKEVEGSNVENRFVIIFRIFFLALSFFWLLDFLVPLFLY